jgi:hypothetical protein
MTESGFKKISIERMGKLKFRRLNLTAINGMPVFGFIKESKWLLSYSYPIYFPHCSVVIFLNSNQILSHP